LKNHKIENNAELNSGKSIVQFFNKQRLLNFKFQNKTLMKIQRKITFLLVSVFAVFLLLFLGYLYTTYHQTSLYRESKRLGDEQIIEKVLDFKVESFLQPVKDNGAWDEMVSFTKTKDTAWANHNFTTIRATYGMTNLSVYSKEGKLIFDEPDSVHKPVILSQDEIKQMFRSSQVVHSFSKSGDNLYEIFGASIVPVVDGLKRTKAYGYLIFAKIWDDKYISELQKATGFKVSIRNTPVAGNSVKTDTIFHSIKGISNNTIAEVTFFKTNSLDKEMSNMQYLALMVILVLILIIIFIIYLTRKWITLPLKKLIAGLSGGKTGNVEKLAKTKGEFGQLAQIINQFDEHKESLLKEINEKTIAERALREANEFAQMIYKVIPSAIFTVDNDKIITSWNKKAELITGFTPEEIIGKSCLDFAKLPCSKNCGLYDSSLPKPISNRECTIAHKSGRIIPILKNVDILKDLQGNVIGGIESFADITERNAMEKELRDSEQRYSTLVCKMPDMIMIHKDGIIQFVNDASTSVIGYSSAELVGTSIMNYLPETSQRIVMEAMNKRASGTEEIKDYETDVRSKSGKIINVIIKTEKIIYDNEPAVLTILIDITERKQFEKMLQERELKLNTITNSANDAIIMIDNDGLLSFWNNAAFKVFGYTEQEVLGKHMHELLAPEKYQNAHNSAFPKFKTTGLGDYVGKTFEFPGLRKDGTEIDIEISLSAIKSNDLWGAVGIVRDITERKKDTELLRQAKDEAERANKAKSEFLALMSHEIRTPINGVIGMTELTLTTQLSKTQREYLEAAQTSAYSLLDTINDILDFSKIEAGKLEIENTEFNLREMVERSIEILNVKAFVKEIELLFEIDPSFPHLFMGDSVRIRQILTNFISNAIKFTEQGEICISVKMDNIALDGNGKTNVTFSVRDTGIGIPNDKLSKIFSSFEQADRSTTRKYGGTGLGLSISKSLADLMEGKIWVESRENVGSTFYFEIPLAISPNQVTRQTGKIGDIRKVLIVDDNNTNLKIMHDMLEYWGVESTIISGGLQALEILKTSNVKNNVYDVVILDMHMPDMDGITVANKIRHELHLDSEPMILMFSSVEKDDIKEISRDAGINKYLTKPVKMQDLYELLTGLYNKAEEPKPQPATVETEQFDQYVGKTILIVEDNSMNMKLMNALLLKTGAQILNAQNGSEAVHIYQTSHPDLIIMDVHMPVVDGFEATRIIRSLEGGTSHITIVALTAITMQGDRERCLECGMDDYLSKPFKMIDLFGTLKKYLGNHDNISMADAAANMIDGDAIFNKKEFLKNIGNDQALFNELIEHFTKSFPALLAKLTKATEATDYEQISINVHALKGMCGNIRAQKLKTIAEQIESIALENGNIREIDKLAKQMGDEFGAFGVFLHGRK